MHKHRDTGTCTWNIFHSSKGERCGSEKRKCIHNPKEPGPKNNSTETSSTRTKDPILKTRPEFTLYYRQGQTFQSLQSPLQTCCIKALDKVSRTMMPLTISH